VQPALKIASMNVIHMVIASPDIKLKGRGRGGCTPASFIMLRELKLLCYGHKGRGYPYLIAKTFPNSSNDALSEIILVETAIARRGTSESLKSVS
jgi:hypothetical protein